jgi:ABC-type Na+ efflux pump permease subunit
MSLFPFTSPIVMVMRLTNSSVPFWQLILALTLLFLTAYLALRSASSMFLAANLFSGQPFSLRRYFAAMFEK